MAEAAPALSAELIEEIETLTAGSWNYYQDNRPADKKAADIEKLEKMGTDEEFKAQRMTEMTESFTAADANGDGRLDAAEWIVWCKAMNARKVERGEFEDDRQSEWEKWYAANNKIDPSQDGVALVDFYQIMGVSMKKMMELKAASEAAQ